MELDDFSGCSNDDRHLIMIKGHRTKRPRPVSQAAAVSVYSDDDSNETGESTVEDEIMANCLIYLAQSGGCIRRQEEGKLLGNVSDSSTTEIKDPGLFVYECKTCNRNFPSFQALGGHRASHKRPKFLVQGDKKPIFTTTTTSTQNHHHEEDEDEDDEIGGKFKRLSPEFTIQLAQKTKIHECSFCGSEFSSGQALGGHMRRHRNSSNAKVNSNTNIPAVEIETEKKKQPRRVFQLDLNLPAPPEDDHRDLKFRFEAAATAASALVDCHY